MRGLWIFAPVVLAGCFSADRVPEPIGIIFDHDEMVLAMDGNFLWGCTMEEAALGGTFRFVLARRVFDGQSIVVLEEAGRDNVEEVAVESDETRDVFILQDASKLFIEADGLAYGGGVTHSRLARYTEGRCAPGGQT